MQAHLASNLFNFFEHRTFHTRHGNWQFGKVRGVGLQGASIFTLLSDCEVLSIAYQAQTQQCLHLQI